MFLNLIIYFVKCMVCFFIVFILYKMYEFIYLPWVVWRKYKKYPNVSVRDQFYPMLGDVAILQKNEAENKFRFHNYIEMILSNRNLDFKLAQMGPLTVFDVCSPKALHEFEIIKLKLIVFFI